MTPTPDMTQVPPTLENAITIAAARTIPPLMNRAGFKADSCIAAVRILHDVLAYFGVRATPIPVSVYATREEWFEPRSRGEYPDGSYAVKIVGTGKISPAGGRWDGHAVVYASGLLVDVTAHQFTRRKQGIVVPNPVIAVVGREPELDNSLLFIQDGAAVVYTRFSDPDWKTSPGWCHPNIDQRSVTAQAIRDIRDALFTP